MCPPHIILHAALISLRRASTFQIAAVTLKDTTIPGPSGKSKENAIDIKRALHEKLWSRIPRPVQRVCTTNSKHYSNHQDGIAIQFRISFQLHSTRHIQSNLTHFLATARTPRELQIPSIFRIPFQIQV